MQVGDRVIDTVDNTLWVIRKIWSDGDMTLECATLGYLIDVTSECVEDSFVLEVA